MSTIKSYTLNDYMKTISLADMTIDEGLFFLGSMTNYALNYKDVSIAEKALKLSKELEDRKDLTSKKRALLYSYMQNIWNANNKRTSIWKNEPIERQIYYGRKAILEEDFSKLPLKARLGVYANLGNTLYQVGRILDAIEYYNMALRTKQDFGMALGAKARAIASCAYYLQNTNTFLPLYVYAEQLFQQAITSNTTEKHALPVFKAEHNDIAKILNNISRSKNTEIYNFYPSTTKQSNAYHTWCLQNNLILNPINIIPHYNDIRDTIHTPSMISNIEKIPPYYAYFNQLKQEFLAARFLCFEGTENLYKKHYSDKYGYLLDTFDSALWDYHTEQIKLAFLTAYSILDKVAVYINDYFNLNQPLKSINFRNIWYHNCDMKINPKKNKYPVLRKLFENHPNKALSALYWLSKDFREEDTNFVLEPEADELQNIRNSLEHRFFQIRMVNSQSGKIEGIYEQLFRDKAIKLLQLVHHALIYLAFAITIEEDKKTAKETFSDGIIAPMILDEWSL